MLLLDLLIAKLIAYGFDMASVKLIYTYLGGRKQMANINDKYSSWEESLFIVPQGIIAGPLLFNIFICDHFLFTNDIDIASYADDNTIQHNLKQTWLLKNLNSVLTTFFYGFKIKE